MQKKIGEFSIEKMKSMIGLTGVTVITIIMVIIMMIAFRGVAAASQPACPTPETQSIKTVTIIECIGMVTHEVKFKWESSNEDLLNSPPLQPGEVYGKVTYNEDLTALDGETKFVKDLDIDTGDTPNLDVVTSMGYKSGEIGVLSHDESVSMTLIANPTATGGVLLCPFARAALGTIPASCEEVSAYSRLVTTEVLATTITEVGITESPVSLHYSITATGSGGAGTMAAGSVSAGMSIFARDGTTTGGGLGLGSVLRYEEESTAHGLFDFYKSMDYESVIRP